MKQGTKPRACLWCGEDIPIYLTVGSTRVYHPSCQKEQAKIRANANNRERTRLRRLKIKANPKWLWNPPSCRVYPPQ